VKIGLVIYGRLDTLTGGYLYDHQMVAALKQRGHEVAVVSLPAVHYLLRLTHNWPLQSIAARMPAGLDLLIQDELCHPSLVRWNTKRRGQRCPVVTLVHQVLCDEPRPSWQKYLLQGVEKRFLDGVDGFIFNSNTTRDTVWRLTASNRPHVVAPPGGDRLEPRPTLKSIALWAQDSGPLRLLFLGNLIPRKGLLPLIEALAGLPRDIWTLRVVGRLDMDRGYVRRVRKTLWSRGVADRVRLLGPREGALLTAELARAQVLCMPYAYEGFGMATLEAQGFGLPAIGCRQGATRELVTDGTEGYLVDPGDHAALQRAMTALHQDRTALAKMSLAARQRFDRHPTWAESMGRLAVFLEDLAASFKAGAGHAIGP
jgi:glycosyltransferase involved in cell wall biosynthesis